jgi:hypothetical protein
VTTQIYLGCLPLSATPPTAEKIISKGQQTLISFFCFGVQGVGAEFSHTGNVQFCPP